MKDTFRYFIRKNFPEVDFSNEEIDAMDIEFHNHLNSILTDDQKESILPKGAIEVIMQLDHPFKNQGFHPAYYLHFVQWVSHNTEAQS